MIDFETVFVLSNLWCSIIGVSFAFPFFHDS